jgi:AraC-like DNA-binding protein
MKIKISNVSKNISEIAEKISGVVNDNSIFLPDFIGSGYYRHYTISADFRMFILNCSFHEEFQFSKVASKEDSGFILFRFINIFKKNSDDIPQLPPAVHMSTSDSTIDLIFAPEQKIQSIILAIRPEYLREILENDDNANTQQINNLLALGKPFLFEEIMSPAIHHIVEEIEKLSTQNIKLDKFYHKVKALELIYFFFEALLSRATIQHTALNKKDIAVIYTIRNKIIQDLSAPPYLPDLAKLAAMSESKLKKIFRYIFGTGIYEYFQTLRMKEAARLLLEEKLSVSETGFRMGFSNLSHFSRLFKQHLGVNPKQYGVKKEYSEAKSNSNTSIY